MAAPDVVTPCRSQANAAPPLRLRTTPYTVWIYPHSAAGSSLPAARRTSPVCAASSRGRAAQTSIPNTTIDMPTNMPAVATALEQQQRCAQQRARQKPVLPGEKIPHRKRRGQHQSDRGQLSDDAIDDNNQPQQGCHIPGNERIPVGQHRKRRQDQKERRRVGPIRVEVIPRSDQCRLDLDELGRVIERGGVDLQRLHGGRPCAGEIGVDRHPGAVDEPGSCPVDGYEERSVDRGDGAAVRLQPPGRKNPEGWREFPVDFRYSGKSRHPAYRSPRANRRDAIGGRTDCPLALVAAVARVRATCMITKAPNPNVASVPIGNSVISDRLRGLSVSSRSAASANFSHSARRYVPSVRNSQRAATAASIRS